MALDTSPNAEAIEAWDGVLFDRFVKFRHLMTDGLGVHGEEALRRHPPAPGDRVIDLGCGFGDTAQRISGIVGPRGSVLGVDVSPRFIDVAREESPEGSAVTFEVADVQTTSWDASFDYAFSRMGTMFFSNPVAAMRNVRRSLVPGGRLCMVVWRRKLDNPWLHRAELVVEKYVEEPEESDEPTCGPGPFSMANADTTSEILASAGFEDIELGRCDLDIVAGRSLDEAIDLTMSLGPAGEVIRLAGDEAEKIRPEITSALRESLGNFVGDDGVARAGASTWIVTAVAPR